MGLLTSRLSCGNTAFTHYYLCPYLPLAAGKDTLSLSILKFKQRIQPDLDAWIACSTQLLSNMAFPPDTIILRALRHEETTARTDFPSALDLLGRSLAAALSCRYIPTLLYKTRATLPGKHLTRHQRRAQLFDVYEVATPPPFPITPSTPFLLIDDILTTGTTLGAIIRCLQLRFPECPIKTFTLTRADYKIPARAPAAADEIRSVETLITQIFANTV